MTNRKYLKLAIRIASFGLLFVLAYSLQLVLDGKIAIFGRNADIMPYMVAYAALILGPAGGIACGAFIGLMSDSVIGKTEGFYVVLFVLSAVAIGVICRKYYRTRLLTGLIMGSICFTATKLVRLIFFYVIFDKASITVLFTYILPECLWSAALSIPFYFVMCWMEKKIRGTDALI